jgi:hypothetical protein
MGVFDFMSDDHERNKQAYNQVYQGDGNQNQAEWSHELVGGGAAFFAMHEYEKKQREEGHQVNHAFAKEMLAGIAGAEVDRLAETKGMDFVDKEKAKHQAKEQAKQMYDQQYGGMQEGGNYY